MKNIIILGSGRSGTSLVASLFAESGYFMGNELYKGRDANPLGFFESWDINGINEDILSKQFPSKKKWWSNNQIFQIGQRWLISPSNEISYQVNDKIINGINKMINQEPFCFKDPRFSFTLPIWKNQLPNNTIYVVVFRHPYNTATSIVKECNSGVAYLKDFKITTDKALKIWLSNYKHILKMYNLDSKNWLFLNYEDLINNSEEILIKLECYTKTKLSRKTIKKELYRNTKKMSLRNEYKIIYKTLIKLSL
ncbi:sulfotransferase [uncultured Lutibacter sp.]|uniref:sulfotransferase n=1 Tax=uncultured Lutibacter sp. TaxID=437739 RepID=UPI00260C32BD|nr:sulfotransferase [uncultured Lutibacter sp.]